jgi:hypothetical protein
LKPETPSRLNFSHLQSVAFIFHCISADCHCLSPHLLDNPTLSHAIYNVNTKNKKIITNREGWAGATGRGKANNCSGYANRKSWSAGRGALQRVRLLLPGACDSIRGA